MDWIDTVKSWDMETIVLALERYEALGPIPGIIVPMLESFLPILPLFAIIMGNAASYGLWEGFLYSWLGVTLGSSTVFWLTRRLGQQRARRYLERHPMAAKFFGWIEKRGFGTIFLLSIFPFSPSAIINIVSGLSNISFRTFLTAILLGKAVMIFGMSFLGHDLASLVEEPWKLVAAALIIGLLWVGGRSFENKMSA